MQVRQTDDPGIFLERAGGLLLADEARHNLLLGLAGTLRDHPEVYPDFRMWLVEDASEVVGAALRTLPYNLVLARPRLVAAQSALVEAIEDEIPGVVGALPEVDAFAESWSAKTGATSRVQMAQAIHALEEVREVAVPPGQMREATAADKPLLLEWLRAFGAEALAESAPDEERMNRLIDHRLTRHVGLVLWEDEGPVSFAGSGGETPNGIRIGPVYTPPELRGRGYASALVAELSATLLAGGRRFCFLYTDLTNPTSNRIYERIGYERVCDSAEIIFEKST